MSGKLKYLTTGGVVLIAAAVFAIKYWDYITNPWTRNGQVFAQVIQITPRVSGPLVKLPVVDNQFVKAGDLLFEIDRRTFEAALEQARAELDNTRDEIQALEKQVEAAQADVEAANATIKQSEASIKGYIGRVEETRRRPERWFHPSPGRLHRYALLLRRPATVRPGEAQTRRRHRDPNGGHFPRQAPSGAPGGPGCRRATAPDLRHSTRALRPGHQLRTEPPRRSQTSVLSLIAKC